MTSCIAAINAGSSGLKFAICDPTNEIRLFQGQIEGIDVAPVGSASAMRRPGPRS